MQRKIIPPSARGKTDRKREAGKSPSIKRPKEVHYIRLRIVQQYFKGVELKADDKEEVPAQDNQQPNLYAQGETEAKEENNEEQIDEKQAPEVSKAKEQDGNDEAATTT